MKKDLYIAVIFSLSLITIFSLGYFTANLVNPPAGGARPPIVIEKTNIDSDYNQENDIMQEGQVVASVNSDKYHYLNCPGAKLIKDENKVYFKDAIEAQQAGFILAGNCK